MSKVCSSCKETLPAFSFNKNRSRSDGLHHACRDCAKKAKRKYYTDNKATCLEGMRRYRRANRDYFRDYLRDYYRQNKSKYPQYEAKRRSRKLNATPVWLTQDQQKEIQDFYWLAKDLTAVSGETYHVDHIVPLQGDNVCGLHVPWNLQILPADINLSKGNRYADNA